ncbi:MAG: hypothetical protein V4561_10045 [Bacteroidota bacterium]
MKSKFFLLALCLCTFKSKAQNKITINLADGGASKIEVTNGPTTLPNTEKLDLSTGAKIEILNSSVTTRFSILFGNNKGNFKIDNDKIASATTVGTPVLTSFTIDNAGKITPILVNGTFFPGMGITIKSADGKPDVILSAVDIKGVESDGQKSVNAKLYKYVKKQIELNGYKYIGGQSNLVIDKEGVIHIYLDENGSPIYSYFPSAAKENFDKFQFHILSKSEEQYLIESDGEFNPTDISDEIKTTVPTAQSKGTETFSEFQSAKFGPYTGSFPFTIKKTGKVIVDRSIKLLKTSRVSLGTSVIATYLKNPENIEKFVKPNGDTTLIADNPKIRGFLGLFLTFHFIPRNLNIQPRTPMERLGISVGTNLTSTAFNNFYLGLNVEITNGLFLNGGINYGQVNYIVGHSNFKFDEEKFTGNFQTKKKWIIGGPYISVNVDAALFAKVFSNILNPTAK